MNYNNYYKNKTLLVTGGTGFVGQQLVSRLESLGAIVHFTGQRDDVFQYGGNSHYEKLDIKRYLEVKRLLSRVKPDIIFHLASIVSAKIDFDLIDEMIDVNLKGTTNILKCIDSISNIECLVNFGSSEEYGNQDIELKENLREEAASPYAILKLCTTRFCNMYSFSLGIPIVTIRPANIFGPGQNEDKFIPNLIINCLNNKSVDMTKGENERNFIFIDDFINAVLIIGMKERSLGQIYNVGSNRSITLRKLAELIKKECLSKSKINFGSNDYRLNEMMKFDLSIDKTLSIGWEEEYNLQQGIVKTIDFYKRKGIVR